MAKSYLDKSGCEPTFFGYKGFPGIICASINKQMVHGIPTDYKLKQGDIVTVDLGATFEGAVADAALCEKYKRHVNILDYERLGVDRNWDDYYPSLLMPVDRRREQEAERERDRQKAIEKEIQHRKVREEYVRNGGTLDEHGNIPVPEGYCQLIDVQRVR